jgi:hypothetical protein
MIVPMTAKSLFSRRGGGLMPLAAKRGWETGSETLLESLIPDREIIYPWLRLLSHNDTPWIGMTTFMRERYFFHDVMREFEDRLSRLWDPLFQGWRGLVGGFGLCECDN